MSYADEIRLKYKQLPQSEKMKIADIFCVILTEQNCIVNSREGITVNWDFKPEHKEVQKIAKVFSLHELNYKQKYKMEKKKHTKSERWKAKAIGRYYTELKQTGQVNI